MDNPDLLLLARAQFGLNIGFHILFPSITIALAWFLVYFRIRYAKSGDAAWLATYKLWVKIFALTFAMGVVTGITMSFQFGTNWPGFMNNVGNIAGPLLAFEVLTAFFLGSHVSRRDAVRHEPGAGLGAHRRHAAGRHRHLAIGVLDPRARFMDANARRTDAGRRHADRGRLAAGDIQPVLPLPHGAHAARLRAHRVLRRRRAVGLAPVARARRTRRRCARCAPACWSPR